MSQATISYTNTTSDKKDYIGPLAQSDGPAPAHRVLQDISGDVGIIQQRSAVDFMASWKALQIYMNKHSS